MTAAATRTAAFVYAGLIALLALTMGSAFVPMGAFNTVVNFAIAAAKAFLVAWFFMHLRRVAPLVRVFAAGVAFWLLLLLGLTLSDWLAR